MIYRHESADSSGCVGHSFGIVAVGFLSSIFCRFLGSNLDQEFSKLPESILLCFFILA